MRGFEAITPDGAIVVTIHDSNVDHIEKNEKVHLQKNAGVEIR